MTYLKEFPDYKADKDFSLPSPKWVDTSWHNDVCPSWTLTTHLFKYRFSADYRDPAMREMQGKRFALGLYNLDDEYIDTFFETDDYEAILPIMKYLDPAGRDPE